jgi:hypothetical protein
MPYHPVALVCIILVRQMIPLPQLLPLFYIQRRRGRRLPVGRTVVITTTALGTRKVGGIMATQIPKSGLDILQKTRQAIRYKFDKSLTLLQDQTKIGSSCCCEYARKSKVQLNVTI